MDDRREDWARSVDENLASVNAGLRVYDRELKLINKLLREFDHILRGDPERETDGAIARLHQQETEINQLKAVVLKDRAGNKGLQGRVEELERADKHYADRIKVWVAIIGLLSAISVAIIANWGRITTYFGQKTDPIENAIDRARNPKPKRRHYVIHDELAPRVISIDEGRKRLLYMELLRFIESYRPAHYVLLVERRTRLDRPFERLPFLWEGKAIYILHYKHQKQFAKMMARNGA